MAVNLIEFESYTIDEVLNDLKLENDYEEVDYTLDRDSKIIICTENKLGITLTLDYNNPDNSIVNCPDKIISRRASTSNFAKAISYIDDISSKFRHIAMDFSSIVRNIEGGY